MLFPSKKESSSIRRSSRIQKRVCYTGMDEEDQSESILRENITTPPHSTKNFRHLMKTPNKRPFKKEIQQ